MFYIINEKLLRFINGNGYWGFSTLLLFENDLVWFQAGCRHS
jgi:hypothetical protein